MLGDAAPEQMPITILGIGRAVVGGSMTSLLTRAEVEGTLEQFLPIVEPETAAASRDRGLGLRELGLPFESDPAITRHLAGFLARAALVLPSRDRAVVWRGGQRLVRPDLDLFNGGFFTPAVARERIAAGAGALVSARRRGFWPPAISKRRSPSAPRCMPVCAPASAAPARS